MLSQAAEYSLRAILCLAAQRTSDRPAVAMTTHDIARRAHVPAGYLAKVLQVLVRARLIRSQRGLNGGFVLNVEPEKLSLLEIVAAVEPSRRITACPLGLPEHRDQLCPLHRRLDEAAAGVEAMLRRTTVADVLSESPPCDAGAHGCQRTGGTCTTHDGSCDHPPPPLQEIDHS